MPATSLVYNERVKLAASAMNLVAIGMIAVGVTTPLVSATYGAQVMSGKSLIDVGPVLLVWLASAVVTHLWAQLVLGRLAS